MTDQAERSSFGDVFALAEFRALWSAQLLSVIGDQLAKVALTVLVYSRTNSPILAALTFAASFVPSFVGGMLLSGLADRLPRRAVMIACDVGRMVLAAVMALPRIPLGVLVALLFAITMISAPFTAARAAVYADFFSGSRYVTATAVTMTTSQIAQVVGFATGGAMTGLLGARPCLLADAATFGGSALLIRFGVRARAAPAQVGERQAGTWAALVAGLKLVLGSPALRLPMLAGWLAAFYNSPEGIAAPFARSLGGGAAITGLLLAFPAAGYCAGALAYSRLLGPVRRAQLVRPLAIASSAILIPIALGPGLLVTLLLLAASGACACFQVSANAAFVMAAPPGQRSQAFGLAAAGMKLSQGAVMILAGAAALHFAPATVIGAVGAVGAVAAAWLTASWPARRRARQSAPGAGVRGI